MLSLKLKCYLAPTSPRRQPSYRRRAAVAVRFIDIIVYDDDADGRERA